MVERVQCSYVITRGQRKGTRCHVTVQPREGDESETVLCYKHSPRNRDNQKAWRERNPAHLAVYHAVRNGVHADYAALATDNEPEDVLRSYADGLARKRGVELVMPRADPLDVPVVTYGDIWNGRSEEDDSDDDRDEDSDEANEPVADGFEGMLSDARAMLAELSISDLGLVSGLITRLRGE